MYQIIYNETDKKIVAAVNRDTPVQTPHQTITVGTIKQAKVMFADYENIEAIEAARPTAQQVKAAVTGATTIKALREAVLDLLDLIED